MQQGFTSVVFTAPQGGSSSRSNKNAQIHYVRACRETQKITYGVTNSVWLQAPFSELSHLYADIKTINALTLLHATAVYLCGSGSIPNSKTLFLHLYCSTLKQQIKKI